MVTWEAPGPGHWMRDRSHMPAGCTPIVQHIVAGSMPAGMRRVFSELGAPLEAIDARFVNGQIYTRLRPLIAPDRPSAKLPPLWVLKIATRVHPAMRKRNRTAAQVQRDEPWQRVVQEWRNGGKEAIERENAALQAVDLAAMTDAGLVEHVSGVIEHCRRYWEHHFWLHGYDLGPLGQFLFEAGEWGLAPRELLSLLEGASPSTVAPTEQLVAIRELVEASGSQPASLDELRKLSPAISERVDTYLERRGAVLFSRYDIDGLTLGECPDLIYSSIVNAERHQPDGAVEHRTELVRAKVPAEHRDRFDHILRQARDAMDLRDDNGPTTAEWPAGLVRLSILEIGRRLVERGSIDDAALALEFRVDELPGALTSPTPTGEDLQRRRADRAEQARLEGPPTLGPAEAAPPLEILPKPLARMVAMVQTVMAQLGMDGQESSTGLHGAGIGEQVARGVARVATSPEDALDLLEPGDILVVASTTPAYNLVLSMAGGVVTTEGGAMSHAAVIARELGIPAVIGARDAMRLIPNGAVVDVDAAAGEVRLVGA